MQEKIVGTGSIGSHMANAPRGAFVTGVATNSIYVAI